MADRSRRRFLGALAATAASPFAARLAAAEVHAARRVSGFGALVADRERLLDLPPGFRYRVISRVGDAMDDGFVVPGLADDMHAFAGPGNATILVRNHELAPESRQTAFRAMKRALGDDELARIYDPGAGRGAVTAVVFDTTRRRVERQHLALAGTLRNCSGGATPWGSWISCEEIVIGAGEHGARRDHGYNFEVPADAGGLVAARPLTAMGRFNHEAVAVDARTGIVYQTEDRGDGLLYRFLPAERGQLAAGGRLQALAVRGRPGVDTGNRGAGPEFPVGRRFAVEWLDVDARASQGDHLRHRGRALGAAAFVRGEGMTVEVDPGRDDTRLWVVCTAGGPRGLGQLWCYRPARGEGTGDEQRAPATLELALEPRNATLLRNGDNLTLAPFGDLLVCEDHPGIQHIVGVTASGGTYRFAANPRGDSELAGVTFSPDGGTLFVNLQRPGLTFAIEGPWHARRDAPA